MTARQSGAIKPTTQGTIDWPASNRNAGRNEIGTGGRLRFGINGRLHRNTHHDGLTAIPGLTILFGFAGAVAVLMLAILIERIPIFGWLAYCGRHSLVIYLAFVIPMAASRSLVVGKFGVTQPDLVMVAVLATAIGAPLILERIVRHNWLRFIFERPIWARLKHR